jgi:hypothetical protein
VSRWWVAVRQHERDPLGFEIRVKRVTCVHVGLMRRCGCSVAADIFAKAGGRDEAAGTGVDGTNDAF